MRGWFAFHFNFSCCVNLKENLKVKKVFVNMFMIDSHSLQDDRGGRVTTVDTPAPPSP
nr:MAG TPA: hypothetical protein [Caudoviricetes sp.]